METLYRFGCTLVICLVIGMPLLALGDEVPTSIQAQPQPSLLSTHQEDRDPAEKISAVTQQIEKSSLAPPAEPALISSNFLEVMKLLLTGLVAAIVAQVIPWIREHFKSKKDMMGEAFYAANRIAVILETYALICADRISNNNLFSESGGHAGVRNTLMPEIPDYPADISWKHLDQSLASMTLMIKNEIQLAAKAIEFSHEVGDPEDDLAVIEFNNQAGRVGYRSWLLAENLRTKYKLPKFDPTLAGWNIVSTLKDNHDHAIEIISRSAPQATRSID